MFRKICTKIIKKVWMYKRNTLSLSPKAGNVDRETHRILHITEGNCLLKAGYQPQRRRKDQFAELHGYHRGGRLLTRGRLRRRSNPQILHYRSFITS